jgi:hypothetical protein
MLRSIQGHETHVGKVRRLLKQGNRVKAETRDSFKNNNICEFYRQIRSPGIDIEEPGNASEWAGLARGLAASALRQSSAVALTVSQLL